MFSFSSSPGPRLSSSRGGEGGVLGPIPSSHQLPKASIPLRSESKGKGQIIPSKEARKKEKLGPLFFSSPPCPSPQKSFTLWFLLSLAY